MVDNTTITLAICFLFVFFCLFWVPSAAVVLCLIVLWYFWFIYPSWLLCFRTIFVFAACCVLLHSHSSVCHKAHRYGITTGTPWTYTVPHTCNIDLSIRCGPLQKGHNMAAIISTGKQSGNAMANFTWWKQVRKLFTKVVCIKSIKKFIVLLTAWLLMAPSAHPLDFPENSHASAQATTSACGSLAYLTNFQQQQLRQSAFIWL